MSWMWTSDWTHTERVSVMKMNRVDQLSRCSCSLWPQLPLPSWISVACSSYFRYHSARRLDILSHLT